MSNSIRSSSSIGPPSLYHWMSTSGMPKNWHWSVMFFPTTTSVSERPRMNPGGHLSNKGPSEWKDKEYYNITPLLIDCSLARPILGGASSQLFMKIHKT